jgi:hypothetical protein
MPRLTVTGTNIDAPDANALADFYRRLLGWTASTDEPGWVILQPPDGGHTLNFQTEERYVRPVWPAGPDDQQMMMHLEIEVDDLEASARAIPSACSSDRTARALADGMARLAAIRVDSARLCRVLRRCAVT